MWTLTLRALVCEAGSHQTKPSRPSKQERPWLPSGYLECPSGCPPEHLPPPSHEQVMYRRAENAGNARGAIKASERCQATRGRGGQAAPVERRPNLELLPIETNSSHGAAWGGDVSEKEQPPSLRAGGQKAARVTKGAPPALSGCVRPLLGAHRARCSSTPSSPTNPRTPPSGLAAPGRAWAGPALAAASRGARPQCPR